MHAKAVQWGSIALVVFFVFLFVTVYIERPRSEEEQVSTSTSSTTANMASDVERYEDPTGFSFSYPKGFRLTADAEHALFSEGTSLLVPTTLTQGTNLASDSRIYVESVQATSTCSAEVFSESIDAAYQTEVVEVMRIGMHTYEKTTYSDAGAGNFYERDVYVTKKDDRCVAVHLFIHSLNIGNYPEGSVTAFDRSMLEQATRLVLESLN